MSKVGKIIIRGLREAVAIAEGKMDSVAYRVHLPAEIDARSIRRRLHMSQAAFARAFGFNVRTLQDYEQGRSIPTGPAAILLRVIAREPNAVKRALIPRSVKPSRAQPTRRRRVAAE